jgi:hypothetical protein
MKSCWTRDAVVGESPSTHTHEVGKMVEVRGKGARAPHALGCWNDGRAIRGSIPCLQFVDDGGHILTFHREFKPIDEQSPRPGTVRRKVSCP